MHAKWAALLSGAPLLLGAANVAAQAPFTLSPLQLDGVVPTYQYDPSRDPLRVSVEALAVPDPDRVRGMLAVEDLDASAAAQQLELEEPEVRCTPARRALLAFAGNSESAAPEALAPRGLVPGGSASLTAQAASPVAAWRDQRLAASPAAAVIGEAAFAHLAPNDRQRVSSSPPAPLTATSPGTTGRRAPAAVDAARPPALAVPGRIVRSDNASGPAGASVLRLVSGATASDILARARSSVDRAMSGLRGRALNMRR